MNQSNLVRRLLSVSLWGRIDMNVMTAWNLIFYNNFSLGYLGRFPLSQNKKEMKASKMSWCVRGLAVQARWPEFHPCKPHKGERSPLQVISWSLYVHIMACMLPHSISHSTAEYGNSRRLRKGILAAKISNSHHWVLPCSQSSPHRGCTLFGQLLFSLKLLIELTSWSIFQN